MSESDIGKLRQMIDQSRYIVFFGGAGVSTESGIPDFRSADGLYHQQQCYSAEELLSHNFYLHHRQEFFNFYRKNMLYLDAKPGPAHLALARLEAAGKLKAVITQNIDGLHQAAGSHIVVELHGSVHRNYCHRCGRLYPAEYLLKDTEPPACCCGGEVKPDVVLYGEPLNREMIDLAVRHLSKADMLIVGGTSLVVYPAAGLINAFAGQRLALINKQPTPSDNRASLVIHCSIGEVLTEISP